MVVLDMLFVMAVLDMFFVIAESTMKETPWGGLGESLRWPGEALGTPWEAMGTLWEAEGTPWEAMGTLWKAVGTPREPFSGELWKNRGKTMWRDPQESTLGAKALRSTFF